MTIPEAELKSVEEALEWLVNSSAASCPEAEHMIRYVCKVEERARAALAAVRSLRSRGETWWRWKDERGFDRYEDLVLWNPKRVEPGIGGEPETVLVIPAPRPEEEPHAD